MIGLIPLIKSKTACLGALNLPVTVLGVLIAIDPVVDMASQWLNQS